MCGIAGIIGSGDLEMQLTTMVGTQMHRGPDASGVFLDKEFAALGHNRLAIIDLSPAANQPFTDPTGRYTLVYNGEVYNYKELREQLKSSYNFQTSCDTEVVLAAFLRYGKDCLSLFNGMFAFAIWDAKQKKLFAARDRFGVKPFYYSLSKEEFYFSSEIKALRAVLPSQGLHEKVCSSYFVYGSYGMPNETFFAGISQLAGGHYLEYTFGTLKTIAWYDFVEAVGSTPPPTSFEEAKQQYTTLLKDSISLRFRADVPVGINISGGVDSSVLLALVNQRPDAASIRAFTFYTGDERYDELPWVEGMVSTTRTPLQKVLFTAAEVEGYAGKIARFQDEPFGGIPTLAYAKIFAEARKQGVKVLLDGQGMDEAWAGYDYYHTGSSQVIQGQREGNSPFREKCLTKEFRAQAKKPVYPEPFDNGVQNKQYRDLFYTKLPRALRFNDRIAMAFSTELREPFLDYRLVEFAFRLPYPYKYHSGQNKYMLREVLKEFVPNEITYAPKRPIQTPQREWLGAELNSLVTVAIDRIQESPYRHWFDRQEMLKEWEVYQNGNQESSFHLWQWVNFVMLKI